MIDARKKRQYLLTALFIVALRIVDLLTTYIYTPRLCCEWNPIVRIFGASWGGLIFSQEVVVGLICAMMYFYFSRRQAYEIPAGLSFGNFIRFYYNRSEGSGGEAESLPKRFFGVPKNWHRILVFNGFIFMALAISVSIFAILNNLLIIFAVPFYLDFMAEFQLIFHPLMLVCFAAASVYLFFSLEYRLYRRAHKYAFLAAKA